MPAIKESKVFDECMVSIPSAIFSKNEKSKAATVEDNPIRPI